MREKKLIIAIVFVLTASLCYSQTPALWGVTATGGAYGGGSIFVKTQSGNVIDVHDFGYQADGTGASGSLLQASDSLLYGLTFEGGVNSKGIIFSYNISTNVEADVHDFGSGSDGQRPTSSLIQVGDSLLYGTTNAGGSNNYGTIFSYNIKTGKEKVLYSFQGNYSDGGGPEGSLYLANNGLLYGVTPSGGTYSSGTLYKFTIATSAETPLYIFGSKTNDSLGFNPLSSVIQAANNLLYGMTPGGGLGTGIIFSYNISKSSESNAYYFEYNNDFDGYLPYGSLTQINDSTVYGLTSGGGTNGNGTIFSFNFNKNTENILYDFGNQADDGNEPLGSLLLASDGLLYGTTSLGGANDSGAIFSFNSSTQQESVLYSFDNVSGYNPGGNLIEVDNPVTKVNRLTVNSEQLSVYPNPSSDLIHISATLKQTDNLQLRLVNMLGQQVWNANEGNVSAFSGNISVANLPGGMYLLQMVTEKGVQTERVVVEK